MDPRGAGYLLPFLVAAFLSYHYSKKPKWIKVTMLHKSHPYAL